MPILKLKSHTYDELYTPTVAMMPLIKHLPSWANRIWCPCDKPDSKIVLALQAAGKEVICTHIDDGHDFFTYEPERGSYDMIITNIPYKDDCTLYRAEQAVGVAPAVRCYVWQAKI